MTDLEKRRLQDLYESPSEVFPAITYRPVKKELVFGEEFEELLEHGRQTFYLKCLNPICQSKGFLKQECDWKHADLVIWCWGIFQLQSKHFFCRTTGRGSTFSVYPAKTHCEKNHNVKNTEQQGTGALPLLLPRPASFPVHTMAENTEEKALHYQIIWRHLFNFRLLVCFIYSWDIQ